jgi:hypothetical protein
MNETCALKKRREDECKPMHLEFAGKVKRMAGESHLDDCVVLIGHGFSRAAKQPETTWV